MRVDAKGKGTGRLSEEAARAAAEAARKAAAAAARAAAEAARKAAAEAARKAAAVAAAEAAKKHTGRLSEAKGMDLGKAPWEKADKAAAVASAVVAGVTTSAIYKNAKDAISAKKKADQIGETVTKLRELKGAGAKATEAVTEGAKDVSKFTKNLGKVVSKADGAMKIVGGVQSALNLRNSVAALKDGVTRDEAIQLSRDVLGTVRGVDAAVKMAGKGSILGKFNPAVAVAGATTDIAARTSKMVGGWKEMSTKDKISNIAGMGASVADIVGAVTPPPVKFAAMGVSAGLSLVSMGAANADKIAKGAKVAAQAVDKAVDATVGAAVDAAKEFTAKLREAGKRAFSGL